MLLQSDFRTLGANFWSEAVTFDDTYKDPILGVLKLMSSKYSHDSGRLEKIRRFSNEVTRLEKQLTVDNTTTCELASDTFETVKSTLLSRIHECVVLMESTLNLFIPDG